MWICAAALALLTAAGCSSGARPDSTSTRESADTVTNHSAPLTVALTAEPASVPAGGRLRITVTVSNTTKHPLVLQFSSGCQTDYELFDVSGALLGASGEMCTQATTQRTLAAGESFSDVHTWIRGMPGMPQLPSSGVMRLRGVLLATGHDLRSPTSVSVTLP